MASPAWAQALGVDDYIPDVGSDNLVAIEPPESNAPPLASNAATGAVTVAPDAAEKAALAPKQASSVARVIVVPSAAANAVPEALQRRLSQAGKVQVATALAKASAVGGSSPITLTVVGSGLADRLVAVNTPWAISAKVPENLLVPAAQNAQQTLHFTLNGLKRELRAGQMFPINLTFEKSGSQRVMANVSQ